MKRKWVPSSQGNAGDVVIPPCMASRMEGIFIAPSVERQRSSSGSKKKKGNDCIAVD
jgi:hypothetical protein